jgi:hypothetical protein
LHGLIRLVLSCRIPNVGTSPSASFEGVRRLVSGIGRSVEGPCSMRLEVLVGVAAMVVVFPSALYSMPAGGVSFPS